MTRFPMDNQDNNTTDEKEATHMTHFPMNNQNNQNNMTDEKEATPMTQFPMNNQNNATDETVSIEDLMNEVAIKADKVREAITARAAYVVATKSCPITSEEIRERIAGFLANINVEDVVKGADVVLRREIGITPTMINYEDDKVILAWDVNPQAGEERKRPYVLWIHVKHQARPAKSQLEKFISFMGFRCPDMDVEIAEEIFKTAWDGELMTIRIFPKASPVVMASKDKEDGEFFLQEVTDGRFIPNRPIAYRRGNQVWVSIPQTEKTGKWTFHS